MIVWDSDEAMEASAESAEERRHRRMETGMASIVSVDAYEIGSLAAGPYVDRAHRRVEQLEEHGEE
jgi:hypothetical protein